MDIVAWIDGQDPCEPSTQHQTLNFEKGFELANRRYYVARSDDAPLKMKRFGETTYTNCELGDLWTCELPGIDSYISYSFTC